MHIVFGIHSLDQETEQIARFLQGCQKKDKNTFFVYFKWKTISSAALSLEKLARAVPEIKSNLLEAKQEGDPDYGSTRIDEYSKSLDKILAGLSKRLEAGEKVTTTGIGGCAEICFNSINYEVQKRARKVFRGKIARQQTFLPLIYGSKYAHKVQAELFNQLKGLLKRQKNKKRIIPARRRAVARKR